MIFERFYYFYEHLAIYTCAIGRESSLRVKKIYIGRRERQKNKLDASSLDNENIVTFFKATL